MTFCSCSFPVQPSMLWNASSTAWPVCTRSHIATFIYSQELLGKEGVVQWVTIANGNSHRYISRKCLDTHREKYLCSSSQGRTNAPNVGRFPRRRQWGIKLHHNLEAHLWGLSGQMERRAFLSITARSLSEICQGYEIYCFAQIMKKKRENLKKNVEENFFFRSVTYGFFLAVYIQCT